METNPSSPLTLSATHPDEHQGTVALPPARPLETQGDNSRNEQLHNSTHSQSHTDTSASDAYMRTDTRSPSPVTPSPLAPSLVEPATSELHAIQQDSSLLDSAKSPRDGAAKGLFPSSTLLSSPPAPISPRSISSSSARMESAQEYQLLTQAPSTYSDQQIAQQREKVSSESFRHLAALESTPPRKEAVAPVLPSTNQPTATPAQHQPAQAQAPPCSLHEQHNEHHEGKEKEEERYATGRDSHPTRTPSPDLLSRLSSAFSSSFRSPSLSLSSSPPPLDTACHCLVVDEDRLPTDPNSPDRKKFLEAIQLATDREALTAHVTRWIQHGTEGICAVHIPPREKPRIHLNFTSLHSLGFCLSRVPFLVRCGSLGTVSQWNSKPCGPPRHKLPEMLHLTCTPTHPKQLARLAGDVKEMLAAAGVEYTAFWFPKTNHERRVGDNIRASTRITLSVLPREISGLEEIITKMHSRVHLWGGALRVHAPNMPKLMRCSQCSRLGHHADHCSFYHGLAIRLLMKEPVSYHAMTTLAADAGARIGYLGSSVEELKPSRRVTLLFDVPHGEESAGQTEGLVSRMEEVIKKHKSLLYEEPTIVQAKNRHRECRECGSMVAPHECVFASFMGGRDRRAPAPPSSTHTSRSTTRGSAGDHDVNMCKSWRQLKKCPRMEKGVPCLFSHPEGHMPKSNACYAFTNTGHCPRGTTCTFKHVATEAQLATAANASVAPTLGVPEQPPAPSPPLNPTPLPPAAPVQSSPSTSTVAARKKRGRSHNGDANMGEHMREEDAAEGPASPSSSPSRQPPSTPSKKQRQETTAITGIPSHSTRWSTMTADEEEEEEEGNSDPPPPTPPAPPSTSGWGRMAPSASTASPSKPTRGRPPTRAPSNGGAAATRASSTSSQRN